APDRSRRGPVHRFVRRLPQPLPEGVSMSLRSLRRPLCMLAAAMVAMPMLMTAPLSPASADGSKEDKIAEREEVDRQLEDLRIELSDVNEELSETYLA